MLWAKLSTAATITVGPILDSTGAEYTGAVIGDLTLRKHDGSSAAMASAATLTHVDNGHYTLVTTTGNMDTIGRLQIRCNKSTYQMPPVEIMVLPAAVYDTLITNGTLASTTSGRTIAVDSSGIGDANIQKILGTTSVGAAGYVAHDMAQAVPTSPTAGTVGEALLMMLNRLGRRGTAQAGTSTTITLDSGASATDNIYSTHSIKIISGTGSGQVANIASYVGSTKVATITRPGGGTWTTNPDNTSVFQIEAVPLAAVGYMLFTALTEGAAGRIAAAFQTMFNVASSVFTTASVNQTGDSYARIGAPAGASASADIASIKTDTGTTIPGRLPAALVSGRMDSSVGAMAANVVTAAAIADGAIDRATFAADTGLQSIRSNTAQAGGSTSITLDSGASASNSFYVNCLIILTGGTGAGQARFITAYVGSTKVASVSAWTTNPDSSTTFAIMGFDSVPGATAPTTAQITAAIFTDLMNGTDFNTAGSFGALVKANIDAATSSRMATYSQPTGFLAATFPAAIPDAAHYTNARGDLLANLDATISSRTKPADTQARVTLVDTVTTYTGNTPQTGDNYARLGAPAGASIAADIAAAEAFADRVVGRGTVGSASTTTSIVTSAMTPAGVHADQFKGRIVIFDRTTTTTALRGQATDITASSAASLPVLTVTALTDAPQAGDQFSIV